MMMDMYSVVGGSPPVTSGLCLRGHAPVSRSIYRVDA